MSGFGTVSDLPRERLNEQITEIEALQQVRIQGAPLYSPVIHSIALELTGRWSTRLPPLPHLDVSGTVVGQAVVVEAVSGADDGSDHFVAMQFVETLMKL